MCRPCFAISCLLVLSPQRRGTLSMLLRHPAWQARLHAQPAPRRPASRRRDLRRCRPACQASSAWAHSAGSKAGWQRVRHVQQHTTQLPGKLSAGPPPPPPPPHAALPRTHEALQVLLGAAHHLACGSQRAGGGSRGAGSAGAALAHAGQAHSSEGGAAIRMSPRLPSVRAAWPLLPPPLQKPSAHRQGPPCAAADPQCPLAALPWLLAAPGRRQRAAADDARVRAHLLCPQHTRQPLHDASVQEKDRGRRAEAPPPSPHGMLRCPRPGRRHVARSGPRSTRQFAVPVQLTLGSICGAHAPSREPAPVSLLSQPSQGTGAAPAAPFALIDRFWIDQPRRRA